MSFKFELKRLEIKRMFRLMAHFIIRLTENREPQAVSKAAAKKPMLKDLHHRQHHG